MPREKARTPAGKKRPASKGPKKRVGGNHGNGKKFQPGTNSHTGQVFQRGPDQIPRGSISLMYRTVLHDAREDLYNNLCKLTQTPRGALAFAQAAADRLEGKPVQKREIAPPRETFFGPAPDPGSTPPGAPPRETEPTPLRPVANGEIVLRGSNGERLRPI